MIKLELDFQGMCVSVNCTNNDPDYSVNPGAFLTDLERVLRTLSLFDNVYVEISKSEEGFESNVESDWPFINDSVPQSGLYTDTMMDSGGGSPK